MKVLLLIIIFLCSMEILCVQYVRVEFGNSVNLECSHEATERCSLQKNQKLEADRTKGGSKFHVLNAQTCIFKANSLNFTDNGRYFCYANENITEFMLLVTVKPDEPELWHLGERIENNSRKLTSTRADGTADFECVSNQGYPQSKFLWFVDDKPMLHARNETRHAAKLIDTKSILTVNFDAMFYSFDGPNRNPSQEKLVVCKIIHDAYNFNESRTLMAVFGRRYATEIVWIKEDTSENIINPNEYKEIICEADGLPEADDFLLKKRVSNGGWIEISKTNVTNVTEPGTYVCEARNSQFGKALGNYVKSQEVTFLGPVIASTKKTLNLAAIVAIVFGSLIFVALLVGIGFYFFCRDKLLCDQSYNPHKSSRSDAKHESEISQMYHVDPVPTEKPLQSDI